MRHFGVRCANALMKLWDLPPLFFRLVIGYFLYYRSIVIGSDAASYVVVFEVLGLILLPLGLLTRLISTILIIVLGFIVDWPKGFDNLDVSIPLYMMLMLFSLVMIGPGRFSLDALFKRVIAKESN